MAGVGIPIKLLHESQGHVITAELKNGQTYRGKLLLAEDNMNVQLSEVLFTSRDGRTSHLEQVYLRGSHIRLLIVPDMLRHAPMFKKAGMKGKGVGMGRGRATVLRAQATRGRGIIGRGMPGGPPMGPR